MMTFDRAYNAKKVLEALQSARKDMRQLKTGGAKVSTVGYRGPNLQGLQYLDLDYYPHWRGGLLIMAMEIVQQRIVELEKQITELGFEVPA